MIEAFEDLLASTMVFFEATMMPPVAFSTNEMPFALSGPALQDDG